MHIAFLNIQGNFDPQDRYWTAHPDFGGQLVYVKEVALAMGRMGHKVDILTRQIVDSQWPGFEAPLDGYPGAPNVRIIRLPCGGESFLRKEELWPFIGPEWVPNIQAFYDREGSRPGVATAHYGDSGLAAAIWRARGGPSYTFTGHSLGAQKLERLMLQNGAGIAELDEEYFFARRIAAERVAANRAARILTSTVQERRKQYGHAAYAGAVDVNRQHKFMVVPPGVNLRIFDAEAKGPKDEQVAVHVQRVIERDIPPHRRHLPVVICSSRLEPKKNHIGLVQAFAHSRTLQAHANLMLVIHGSEDIHNPTSTVPEEKAVLDEMVAACDKHGLWGTLSTLALDSQEELAAAYRHLSRQGGVFALTALYEPFGLAPLEAAAAGLPVVVTENGGPSESLRQNGEEYGVLIDPMDPADIARGLLRLLGDKAQWQRFRQAGRRRVLGHYTWENTARGYLDALQGIRREPGEDQHTGNGRLPIPDFFLQPGADNDLGPETLFDWFEESSAAD